MNALLVGNAKSKTSWLGILLIALGSLQEFLPQAVDLIPPEHYGKLTGIVGFAVVLLRNVTKGSITDKANATSSP